MLALVRTFVFLGLVVLCLAPAHASATQQQYLVASSSGQPRVLDQEPPHNLLEQGQWTKTREVLQEGLSLKIVDQDASTGWLEVAWEGVEEPEVGGGQQCSAQGWGDACMLWGLGGSPTLPPKLPGHQSCPFGTITEYLGMQHASKHTWVQHETPVGPNLRISKSSSFSLSPRPHPLSYDGSPALSSLPHVKL